MKKWCRHIKWMVEYEELCKFSFGPPRICKFGGCWIYIKEIFKQNTCPICDAKRPKKQLLKKKGK